MKVTADPAVADDEVVAVTFDRRIRNEVIEIRVVCQGSARRGTPIQIHQLPQELKDLGFWKPFGAEVA